MNSPSLFSNWDESAGLQLEEKMAGKGGQTTQAGIDYQNPVGVLFIRRMKASIKCQPR